MRVTCGQTNLVAKGGSLFSVHHRLLAARLEVAVGHQQMWRLADTRQPTSRPANHLMMARWMSGANGGIFLSLPVVLALRR